MQFRVLDRLPRALKFVAERCRDFGLLRGLAMAIAYRQLSHGKPGKLMAVRPPGVAHPILLRAGTSDAEVFDQIFARREVDFRLNFAPEIIVDAGANVGLASIVFANRFKTATIYAIELQSDNFALLQKNVAHYPNIKPIHGGLWSRKTTLRVANPGAAAWAFRAAESAHQNAEADNTEVDAFSVADLMKRFSLPRIDLLKLDIEGGELEVLGSDDIGWLGAVRTLAVELHDREVAGCSDALNRAVVDRPHRRTQLGEYSIIEFSAT